ncbi:glycosyltransferase [Lutibacter citreus]|uniref:glycosyltransferase n=1 Tax=Lutibacter citreus TaxID=2138210 RepID=UPI000DBEA0F4|nr:glycosyltransferase [Lutibacter citreus]
MKILRVINSLHIGGAERSIVGNVPLHIKNGYATDVLLLNGEDTFFLKELKEQNVPVISLGKSNMLFNPFFILKISRIINNYDIVHAHLFPSFYIVAFAKIFRNSKTKLVFTEHSTSNNRRGKFIFKWIERFIYNQYDKIIAITPEANINLKQHLRGNENITVIYNGVDLVKIRNEKNQNRESFNLNVKLKDKTIITQIASFRSQKDQDTLIRSLALLPENFHVLFVGDGARMSICKELTEKLGVADQVSFLGLQNNVGAILNKSSIVVMSSNYEGFGRAAIEGMAAGKPVIASNVPGLSKIVEGAGLLFEPRDEKMLSNLILKLSNDSNFYNQTVKKCLNRAEEFDISKMVKEYEDVYDNLFNS